MYFPHTDINIVFGDIMFSYFHLDKNVSSLWFVNASNVDIISSALKLITCWLFLKLYWDHRISDRRNNPSFPNDYIVIVRNKTIVNTVRVKTMFLTYLSDEIGRASLK